jgi:hypothetical protein
MVIVDTSVLLDYLADYSTPQTEWLEEQMPRQRIGITSLVLMEVLQGIRRNELFEETLRQLKSFVIFETGDQLLAIASARNYRLLRQRGITIRSSIDCITATFCIEKGHKLLHRDRDFDGFESHLGLLVVNTGRPN